MAGSLRQRSRTAVSIEKVHYHNDSCDHSGQKQGAVKG